ncbi:hypothetical protein FIV42_14775 [Persicimonas caeni]|uniref:Uncharacterized protein n=1 Tax=Persicimonas caeni TaxID=2292766 RepID=A0A4Y6PUE5_PERCE|nr:MXAN_2562 family outer membrane beta-barrel protein [Persicimonas caeni]QDG51956.1 hypothetical protein FIV42_14775 [Persicimonas caeni]QED33177.1 hypothetical protein FRD00_14770 [Persicimonas caeni]
MKCLFALPAALLPLAALPATGTAVELEDSTIVTNVEIGPTGQDNFFDVQDNGQLVIVGQDECISLFERKIEIAFKFQLSSQPESVVDFTRVFAVPTDQTPDDFECDEDSSDDCTTAAVDNTDFTDLDPNTEFNFGAKIEFSDLVSTAVEGQEITEQATNNEIELLLNKEDCTELEVDQQYFYRIVFNPTTTGDVQTRVDLFDAVVELDTKPPTPPTDISSVVVTEAEASLNWRLEGDQDVPLDVDRQIDERAVNPFVLFYSERDLSELTVRQALDADDVFTSPLIRDNLNNDGPDFSGNADLDELDLSGEDSRIFIAIASRDDAGNYSELVIPGAEFDPEGDGFAPVPVIDFWENYKEAGGAEAGGCSTTGGPLSGSAAVLGLLGLGLFGWRRRRRLRQAAPVIAAIGAFGLVATASPDAHAQSPTWGLAELRIGGYYPSIDDEAGLQGEPFREIFGGGSRVLVEYEQGVHIYDGFGAFGASGSFGYTHFGGKALVDENSGLTQDDINAETGMMVIPLRAGLYYQLDQLQEYWDIPLAPILKGGVDYFLWQIEDSAGDTADVDGQDGDGGTWGWHVAAGLQLGLDWIDPSSSGAMDYNWGINHTYAFAEYQIMEVDDFGASDSFILSDDRWVFGLAFEY